MLVETVRFKQLNGLLCNTRLVSEINLCSLCLIEDQDSEAQPTSSKLQSCAIKNTGLEVL